MSPADGERIAAAFARGYRTWAITLPPDDVAARRRGVIRQAGWTIQYVWGHDADGEYLDIYASHRMTNDDHYRLRADGSTEGLPSLMQIRAGSEDPEEDARLDAELMARNRHVADVMKRKGFRFTFNQAVLLNPPPSGAESGS